MLEYSHRGGNVADEKLAGLLKTQKSLTEWFADIKHKDVAVLRKEDNEKRERLRVLHETIGLPFDKPTQFTAQELQDKVPRFLGFLEGHGQEPCALRLIPTQDELPKLRMRGKSISDAYQWFLEQDIDPAKYRADFMPHPPDYSWATIFIVNEHAIQGEIIFGGHYQLTQGFHEGAQPMLFHYDFKDWLVEPKNDAALAYLKETIGLIHVTDAQKRKRLKERLGTHFIHNYIAGYFETIHSSLGTWYIDYSKTLGDLYADLAPQAKSRIKAKLSGRIGCPGVATGPVCIVRPESITVPFPAGSILVCSMTTPEYAPLMQKAAGIVTDQGGILSHAAIVARELHKPCIVGTGDATKRLADGQLVTVNADEGTVSVV
jgi:phosphohistidine swiveling domain-containing protein